MHISRYTRLRSKLYAYRCHRCSGRTLAKVWLGYTKCKYCFGTGLNREPEAVVHSLIKVSGQHENF